MGRRIEYVEQNVIATSNEIEQFKKYHEAAIGAVGDTSTFEKIVGLLDEAAGVLEDVLTDKDIDPIPVKVANVLIDIFAELTTGEAEGVKQILENGYRSLEAIGDDMETNNWMMVKMDIPWLEFVDEGIRAVQGNCFVSQYYKNGAWHDLNKLYAVSAS